MAAKKASQTGKGNGAKQGPQLKLGDRVKIHYSDNWQGRIVELRGPLGVKGAQVYRVRIRRKPKPIFIELPEDMLELIPPDE
jgi:hypothetical protein